MASESQAGPVSTFPMIMMIIGIGVIGAALVLNEPWYYIGVFLFINSIALAIGRSLPPFVLLLSSSNDQIEVFYNKIMAAIIPLWISALTQLEYKSRLSGSRLRTLRRMPDRPWMEVVESSMEMAKVIVLDMRDVSTHVRSEVEAVRRLGLQYKTLLIISPDAEKTNDRAETDDQVALLQREALSLAEKEALLLLRRLRRNVDDLPRVDRALKEIVVV